MLVLSRKEEQDILIGLKQLIPLIKEDPETLKKILLQPIVVKTVRLNTHKARIGIEADTLITVNRREIEEAKCPSH
jgi:sRNA-binding carbon storage regulator CsrA